MSQYASAITLVRKLIKHAMKEGGVGSHADAIEFIRARAKSGHTESKKAIEFLEQPEVLEGLRKGRSDDLQRQVNKAGERGKPKGTKKLSAMDTLGSMLFDAKSAGPLPRGKLGNVVGGSPAGDVRGKTEKLVRTMLKRPEVRKELRAWQKEQGIEKLDGEAVAAFLVGKVERTRGLQEVGSPVKSGGRGATRFRGDKRAGDMRSWDAKGMLGEAEIKDFDPVETAITRTTTKEGIPKGKDQPEVKPIRTAAANTATPQDLLKRLEGLEAAAKRHLEKFEKGKGILKHSDTSEVAKAEMLFANKAKVLTDEARRTVSAMGEIMADDPKARQMMRVKGRKGFENLRKLQKVAEKTRGVERASAQFGIKERLKRTNELSRGINKKKEGGTAAAFDFGMLEKKTGGRSLEQIKGEGHGVGQTTGPKLDIGDLGKVEGPEANQFTASQAKNAANRRRDLGRMGEVERVAEVARKALEDNDPMLWAKAEELLEEMQERKGGVRSTGLPNKPFVGAELGRRSNLRGRLEQMLRDKELGASERRGSQFPRHDDEHFSVSLDSVEPAGHSKKVMEQRSPLKVQEELELDPDVRKALIESRGDDRFVPPDAEQISRLRQAEKVRADTDAGAETAMYSDVKRGRAAEIENLEKELLADAQARAQMKAMGQEMTDAQKQASRKKLGDLIHLMEADKWNTRESELSRTLQRLASKKNRGLGGDIMEAGDGSFTQMNEWDPMMNRLRNPNTQVGGHHGLLDVMRLASVKGEGFEDLIGASRGQIPSGPEGALQVMRQLPRVSPEFSEADRLADILELLTGGDRAIMELMRAQTGL